MLRWASVILIGLIVVVSVLEFTTDRTPLEQLTAVVTLGGTGRTDEFAGVQPEAVIRMGVASWQMDEFPWEETVRRYEHAHGGKVRVKLSILPEGSLNSMLLYWHSGYTKYDMIVAWADEEIHPFITYNWNTTDPARRSLLVNMAEHLTDQQLQAFVPTLFVGSSMTDPQTGKTNLYELPWMGEVTAINYNKVFFKMAGVDRPPTTWEEVEEACEKLKGLQYKDKRGTMHTVAPLAMVFAQSGFFTQNHYIPMLAAFKKGRGVTDAQGHLDVSSPEAAEVFKTLKRWYEAGYITEKCKVQDSVEQELRVFGAAMYPHWQSRGLWAVADHGEEIIGIAPTPGVKQAGSLVCTYGCIVPKCSPVVEQAVEFAYEAFCTDTHGFQTAVANGFIDPTTGKPKGGKKMPAITAMYDRKDLPAGIRDLRPGLEKGYFYPDPTNYNQCADIVVVWFQRYLFGDKNPSTGKPFTAEEALTQAQHEIATEVYTEK